MNYELDSGYKIIYSLPTVDKTFIEKMIASIGLKEDVSEIRTGRAGQLVLKEVDSKYKDLAIHDEMFDPTMADQEVNPLINGWRYSSHIFYITTDNQLIKVIPKVNYKTTPE